MDALVLHFLVGAREDTLTVLAGKSWLILVHIGGLFIGIAIAVQSMTFMNLQMHLIVCHVFKFAITSAAQKLLLALMHLFVHSQQVLLKAVKELVN